MVERVKHRDDVDGCACLECRGVRSIATRRGIGDVLLWSVGFLRDRQSIPLVFLALGVVQFAGYVGPLGLELATSGLVFFAAPLARGYAVTIVSGEITGHRYTPRRAAGHALRRTPAVIATMMFVGVATMGLVFVGTILGIVVVLSDSALLTGAGIVALLVLFVLLIVVLVKFILAAEAVVVGGYGPIAALRVSWGLVSFRRRTTIVLVSMVVAIATAFAMTEISATLEPYPIVGAEMTATVVFGGSTALTYLSSAVSAAVFCHLYVQGVLE
ncbi:hypothetical protein [Natrialba sp. INN-245]|uniref:hypothetical protein n=1 Tax=Natrialba sp. INN-245 TaxID=2690967 RepID=UPI0013111B74|nr:hypothetical protein [Natrialba sp. INN-245]MWV38558.1 hypothetical protein [Natrialba sp. INN-245]